MRPALPIALACLVLAWLGTGSALAHEFGEPLLYVPADNVVSGEPFDLWGVDLDPSATVLVEVVLGGQVLPVATVLTDADGHFTQSVTLPAGLPDGYTELIARADGGTSTSTYVFVGEGPPEGVAPLPLTPLGGQQWWSDPSVLILAAFLGGAAIALLWLAVRSRRPAAAPVRAHGSRPLPRKTSRKARRRPT